MDPNPTVYVDFGYDDTETTFFIKGIISPAISSLAIVINVVIMVIYSSQHKKGSRKRRSANVLILGISFTFLMLFVPYFPWNMYMYGLNNIHKSKSYCLWWNVFDVMHIGPFTTGTIICVTLLYQRYTVLKWPLKANSWWSPCKSFVIVVIATVFGMFISLSRIFSFDMNLKLELNATETNDTIIYICERTDAEWISSPQIFDIVWALAMLIALISSIGIIVHILVYIYKTHRQTHVTNYNINQIHHRNLKLEISNSSSDTNLTKYVINAKRNSPQRRSLRVSTNRIVILALALLFCQSFLCIGVISVQLLRMIQYYGICLIETCKSLEDTILKGPFTTIGEPTITSILSFISMYSFLMTKQVKSVMCTSIKINK